ncbi:hypothetical protein IQ247_13345 [Plectonema cf. radiosum LEGE 06105]|uniref:Uncharacterized protein n=1 Tax=Plectonema cf. radiosum LEGE 06105 TaxID=945769 RepID=A0A8J7F7T0_9CYAN|nr:hypothetical protein [Plectonema radiosum]MBE9213639.1 hypothetical protein [Plectonema cf. radiosum LEGE 06105]
MGEAKRRKQLDPNWGKPKSTGLSIEIVTQEEEKLEIFSTVIGEDKTKLQECKLMVGYCINFDSETKIPIVIVPFINGEKLDKLNSHVLSKETLLTKKYSHDDICLLATKSAIKRFSIKEIHEMAMFNSFGNKPILMTETI